MDNSKKPRERSKSCIPLSFSTPMVSAAASGSGSLTPMRMAWKNSLPQRRRISSAISVIMRALFAGLPP